MALADDVTIIGNFRLMGFKVSRLDTVVGMRIRHCRWKSGLRQEDIASRLGISLQQMRRYEAGESRISASRLFEIACILDVPITLFFVGLSAGEDAGTTDDALPEGAVLAHPLIDRDALQRRILRYVDCLLQPERDAIMAMLQAMAEARGCRADIN